MLSVAVVLVLASACGRAGEQPPPVTEPCDAAFARGEFGTGYAMVSALSNAPSLGETATFTVGICAKETARATVSVHLFDGVEWRTPPAGTTVTHQPWAYGGCEEIAAGEWELRAMTPLTLTGTVAATELGVALLEAHVDPVVANPGQGNTTTEAITVGNNDASSHYGLPEHDNESSATSATPTPVCD